MGTASHLTVLRMSSGWEGNGKQLKLKKPHKAVCAERRYWRSIHRSGCFAACPVAGHGRLALSARSWDASHLLFQVAAQSRRESVISSDALMFGSLPDYGLLSSGMLLSNPETESPAQESNPVGFPSAKSLISLLFVRVKNQETFKKNVERDFSVRLVIFSGFSLQPEGLETSLSQLAHFQELEFEDGHLRS